MNGSVKGTRKRTGIVLLSEVPVPVLKMRNLCRHFVFSKLGSVLSVKVRDPMTLRCCGRASKTLKIRKRNNSESSTVKLA